MDEEKSRLRRQVSSRMYFLNNEDWTLLKLFWLAGSMIKKMWVLWTREVRQKWGWGQKVERTERWKILAVLSIKRGEFAHISGSSTEKSIQMQILLFKRVHFELWGSNRNTLHMSGRLSASSSYILMSVSRLQAALNNMYFFALLCTILPLWAETCLCECCHIVCAQYQIRADWPTVKRGRTVWWRSRKSCWLWSLL